MRVEPLQRGQVRRQERPLEMDDRWRIKLLGELRAQREERVITRLVTRKTEALLAYLALTHSSHNRLRRPLLREELIELLWPECEPRAARQSLRQALSSLRRQLEPPGIAPGSVLVADRAAVRLDSAAVTTDVAEFEAAIEAGAGGSETARVDSLLRAVELYQGELLPGRFEEWVLQERQWLEEQYFRALGQLLFFLEQRGELHRALQWAQRGMSIDPLREEACRDLMRLYAAAGQATAALNQYRALKRRLQEQLQAPPEPATAALAREIERLVALQDPGIQGFGCSGVEAGSHPIPEPLNTRPAEDQSPEGENRLITVLSAAVCPSARSHDAPTREAATGATGYLRPAMARVLLKYGGRWESGRGEETLVIFGVPQAHESDAERAIRAAMEIRQAAERSGLSIRVGIETGQAYVAASRPGGPHRVTRASRAVTHAVTLMGQAELGQILVGETTCRLTRHAFEFTRPSQPGQTAARPLPGGAVAHLVSQPRKVLGIEDRCAELIGREEELARLNAALAAVLQPDSNGPDGGRIVCLIGEAGVGKSRLVAELKAARNSQLTAHSSRLTVETSYRESPFPLWLEGRCLEWGVSAGYAVFADLFRDHMDEWPEEGAHAQGERLAAHLRQLVTHQALSAARVGEIGPLLGNLLSIRSGDERDLWLKNASPEQIRHQTFLAVRDFFVALSRRRPVILVFEDLHWADHLSLELISLLMETLPHTPLFLLCVYRPEREHRCRHLATIAEQKCGERCIEIALRELQPPQSRRLVESLLPGDPLPPVVIDALLEKARGNPFFIREMVHALIEAELLTRDPDGRWVQVAESRAAGGECVTVPESIQSVILSRIDRLDPRLNGVLERAAVIGPRFPRRVLEAVRLTGQESGVWEGAQAAPSARPAGTPSLTSELCELEERGLIYQQRVVPEEEYSFRHVLMQEAIYQRIPQWRRSVLHQQVAEALEALYPDRMHEQYEQLAYHYERSAVEEKAVVYLFQAGEKARRSYDNEEAISYFQRTLERLDDCGFSIADCGLEITGQSAIHNPRSAMEWRLEALTRQGQVHLVIGQAVDAEKRFREAIAAGEEVGLVPRQLVRLYHWLAQALFGQSRCDEMLHLAEEGLARLGEQTESIEAAWMNDSMAMAHFYLGDCPKYLALHHRNAQFLERLPYSEELRPVYDHIIEAHLYGDRDAEAAARWAQLLEWNAQQHHDLRGLASARYQQGQTAWMQGDVRGAIPQIQHALELFRRIGDASQEGEGLTLLAWMTLSSGEIGKAREYAVRAHAIVEAVENQKDAAFARQMIGWTMLSAGSWGEATAEFRKAIELYREIGHLWEVLATCLLGRVALAQGQRREARRHFEQALSLFRPGISDLPTTLNGLEAACAEPQEFRTFCLRFREEHPEIADPFFIQWYLEPAQPDCGFQIADCGLPKDQNQIRNPQSEIRNDGWVWHDPLGDCAYHVGNGLEIRAANWRSLRRPNLSAPRLLRKASGEFAVETVCLPAAAGTPAIGGLLLWKDAGNFLRVDRGTQGETEITFSGCIQNSDHLIGRGQLPASERIFLRLERRGARVRALCSADGQAWFTVGDAPFPPEDPVEVGVHAIGRIDRCIYPGAFPEGSAIRFEALRLWRPAS